MTTAYKQGRQAAADGLDIIDNHYKYSTLEYNEWFSGFADWIIDNDCVMSA